MKYKEPTPDDYIQIAEKVRSGEYFREAKSMYDVSVNDPMSERYFYVFVTTVALLTLMFSVMAVRELYPLKRPVPFIYALNDVLEDLPSITPLRSSYQQTTDEAVLFFMAKTFVAHYEGYNINLLERNYGGIEHHATPEVFAGYQRMIQTGNPDSPVVKYQRHTARIIDPVSVQRLLSPANTVEVVYDATLISAEGSSRSRHKATISYDYSGVEIDKKTGMVNPVSFTVTRYSSKIQDTP